MRTNVEPLAKDAAGNLYVSIQYHRKELEQLKTKINKAIEHIEKHKEFRAYYSPLSEQPSYYKAFVGEPNTLLEILKGKSE